MHTKKVADYVAKRETSQSGYTQTVVYIEPCILNIRKPVQTPTINLNGALAERTLQY